MKILVIGGSYFYGRWFVQLAYKNHEISVLNRGNIPVGIPEVTEYVADRHNEKALKDALAGQNFDCVVDFCAYAKGDIKGIIDVIGSSIKRYVFISTVDVYARGTGQIQDEDAEFEIRDFPGPEGAYISGKVALERELEECAEATGIAYTSVRPSILYGPANYAPREQMFFDWIKEAGQIILPLDETGCFQPIFVGDAAEAVIKICEKDEEKLMRAYNLCSNETENYASFAQALHAAVDKEFTETKLPVAYIAECQIPLPFPLTAAESEQYAGKNMEQLGIELTPLSVGLKLCLRQYEI